MSGKPYRIPVKRLQEEWAFRLSMERLRKQRGSKPVTKITDNSEPWLQNPRTVDDLWFIATQINRLVEKWGPRQANSSES